MTKDVEHNVLAVDTTAWDNLEKYCATPPAYPLQSEADETETRKPNKYEIMQEIASRAGMLESMAHDKEVDGLVHVEPWAMIQAAKNDLYSGLVSESRAEVRELATTLAACAMLLIVYGDRTFNEERTQSGLDRLSD